MFQRFVFALLTLFLPLTQDATLTCCVNVREIFAFKRACWVTGGNILKN